MGRLLTVNTDEPFVKMAKIMAETERSILVTKGTEYAGEIDRFANFRRLSVDLGLSKEMILFVYMKKHLDSILSFIKTGKEASSESIFGRIMDARNYLLLLSGLIAEHKAAQIDKGISPKADLKEDEVAIVECFMGNKCT